MPTLLVSVRFHDGRYHGSGEWPPSPARLFQALVAGAARGESLPEQMGEALHWLEGLAAPAIAAPTAFKGQSFKNFVPNNDLDAVGGDPARIGEIRTAKLIHSRTFDAAVPLLYAWTFAPSSAAERHAQTVCDIAHHLYQLGRGVDMAWAGGEVVDESEAESQLSGHAGTLWRPAGSGDGTVLSCPHLGSLASLDRRFKAMRGRFRKVGTGKKASLLFSQASKSDFRQVPYNSPSTFLLFDIRNDDGKFAWQPLRGIVAFTENVRGRPDDDPPTGAAGRLLNSTWRQEDPKRKDCVDKVFVGRGAEEADKARRIHITPLPSIGYAQTVRSIRRVLVTVPPDCPIATDDVAWAFSGLALDFDPDTGEVSDDSAELVPADDRTMLKYYGIENAGPARLWRTVTPAALPERAARRRIDPRRIHEDAKGGAERLREQAEAERAARQALRHVSIDTPVEAVRVQREPFETKGRRAEAFEAKPRFAKERLWHVEVAFARPVPGPLVIGDGRYLGLGLMAPAPRTYGILSFVVTDGLTDHATASGLTRALRRAVMVRVQERVGERTPIPPFFTGHSANGAPARSGRHEHLSFAFDAPRQRLLIIAPHILERRDALKGEREHLRTLEAALDDFRELRAGAAGKLAVVPGAADMPDDPLFAPSRTWESATPYRVTRHAKLDGAAAALEADLLAECLRAGLPRPQIDVAKSFAKPGTGLFGLVKLSFHGAVAGPLLLGRDRHFGGGLFAAVK
jgi:CRISPR-associated protein Csb2